MDKEQKRTKVLEMMLKDGFEKIQQIAPNVSEFGKGTQRLYYDEQRDVIVKTYDIKIVGMSDGT